MFFLFVAATTQGLHCTVGKLGNKFTGTVPQELCDRYLNKDFFEGHPSGNDRDGCTSVACPANTKAFQGIFPCHTCAESFLNPYLGSNQCIGLEQVSKLSHDELTVFY